MWLEIIDVEIHLRKQNTQGAYKGGITLEEIILETPRTTMLEQLGGNLKSLVSQQGNILKGSITIFIYLWVFNIVLI